MAKRIFSIVVALLVSMAIIMGFEQLGGLLFKTPAIDPKDNKTISDMMQHMPIAAFLWLLLGYAVSSFLGGLIATFISGRKQSQPAMIVGAFLLVGGIMNFIMIPYHPIWVMITAVLLFIPCAWLGYLVAKKKKETAA